MSEPNLLDVAISAAEAGARCLLDHWRQPRRIRRKGPVDLVTDADLAAESAVLRVIRAACPDDAITTEESQGIRSIGHRRWLVDPLDGTTNFAHSHPHFAVSVAAADASGVLVAVVHDPLRDEIFRAVRGGGAWLGSSRLRVSATASLDDSLIATGFPYDRRSQPERYLGHVAAALRACQGIRRAGSAALDLAWTAAGRLDAFWEWKLAAWDVAAGSLLVEEAGGRVTTIEGTPHSLEAPSILASNGHVHSELGDLLRRVDVPNLV